MNKAFEISGVEKFLINLRIDFFVYFYVYKCK